MSAYGPTAQIEFTGGPLDGVANMTIASIKATVTVLEAPEGHYQLCVRAEAVPPPPAVLELTAAEIGRRYRYKWIDKPL